MCVPCNDSLSSSFEEALNVPTNKLFLNFLSAIVTSFKSKKIVSSTPDQDGIN